MSLRFKRLMEEYEAFQMNALQLAYIGDAVWDMIIRQDAVFQKFNIHHMHLYCVNRVNAGAQAEKLSMIRDQLTEREEEIVRRGRNSHAKHPSPKNQDPQDYSASTGFEALLGYLYLSGQDERIEQLVNILRKQEGENGNTEKT